MNTMSRNNVDDSENNTSHLLIDSYPDLLSEWDYEKNNHENINVSKITYGSRVKAYWKCLVCNGSYWMKVHHRTSGHGCPYCAGQKVLKGYNDLASQCPELVYSEWDWAENNYHHINPYDLTKNSSVMVYWKCNVYKHDYMMRIKDRTGSKPRGCPYCARQKVLAGFNDLMSNHPDLIQSSWDWIENNRIGLKPDAITSHSRIKAYWRCEYCKHSCLIRVDSKVNGHDCLHCSNRISKQENQVVDFIREYLCEHYDNMKYTMFRSIKFKRIYELLGVDIDMVLSDDLQAHLLKELDVYIPELSLAIEYDGDYWHDDKMMLMKYGMTNSEAHKIKQQLCEQAGIKIIFITEHDWLSNADDVKNLIIDCINDIYCYMICEKQCF